MGEYERKIVIPRNLRLAEDVYNLKIDSLNLQYADICTVDFLQCGYGEPMPMLLLAEKVRSLAARFPKCKYRLLAGRDVFHTFADHIGFFRYMGWPRGREPGEAWGSGAYIPIESFSIEDFRKRAGAGPIGELINVEASRMARVLSQEDEGPTYDVLQYAIREIVRNAAEHSRGSRVTIMAQFWPTKHIAEIVVIDDGVGIPANLYENDYVECNNSREALKFALLPGISGVSLSERIEQDPFWGNSGFGLFVTSRICSENGQFRIISDQQGLTLVAGNQIEHNWLLNGTCVQMRLDTRKARNIHSSIPKLVEEGESKRKTLMNNYPIQASAASKMLESQYRKRMS